MISPDIHFVYQDINEESSWLQISNGKPTKLDWNQIADTSALHSATESLSANVLPGQYFGD